MRNWFLISTLVMILMPFCLRADRLVALGDSLTAGYGLDPQQAWPALLEKQLRQDGLDLEVANAGLSGDTSAGGLRRLNWVLGEPADWMVIALGANDALRGQPIEATRENLRKIIRRAREKYPQIRIVLAGMLAPPNMGEAYTEAFGRIYSELAEEEEVLLYPFILEGVAARPALNQADGIHPNAKGQEIIAGHLAAFIRENAD